jgi:hypothetical protein
MPEGRTDMPESSLRSSASPSRKERGWIRQGEVRKPKGNNLYTYRREFECSIDSLRSGDLSEDEAKKLPQWIRHFVRPGMGRGEALACIVVEGALRGEEKHFLEALKP